MAKRSLLIVVLALGCGVGLAAGGWWIGALSTRHPDASPPDAGGTVTAGPSAPSRADADRIEKLQMELAIVRRQLEQQRHMLREPALNDERRTIDEMLALFPAPFPKGNWAPAETAFEDCWFEAVDGVRLHGWYLPHADPAAVILYAHGNAGNVAHRAAVAAELHRRLQASILVFDYRGYGRSEGLPTMEGIVRDARAARDYLAIREGISTSQIVFMGRSLGGAVAVQLASDDGARALVLESTFSSLRELAASRYPKLLVNLLVADRLDSASAIQNYRGPLLQSHGDADRTIPIASGWELFNAANEPKQFVPIAGGDHNDRPPESYYHRLRQFIQSLPAP